MDETGSERIETVVIGAGQAGLSAGYSLKRAGRSFVILDANAEAGGSWLNRYDSLQLFTPRWAVRLPGWRFQNRDVRYPSRDQMVAFLQSYAERFDLPVRTGVRVERISREGDGYLLSTDAGPIEAGNVIVATGANRDPRIPTFSRELDPSIVQLHSSEYRNPSQLREGGVLVVGAGNSGAEIALESSASHPIWLSGRDTGQEPVRAGGLPDRLFTPPFWFLLSHILTVRTPMGRRARQQLSGRGLPLARVRRKDLDRAGVERVPRVTGVRDGLPTLADGATIDPANVVWCTGFMPDFRWIDLPIFDDVGEPRHDRGVVRSAPGLYFIGLFFLSSGSSSLIGGVGRDAAHIARHIASQRAEGRPAEQWAHTTRASHTPTLDISP